MVILMPLTCHCLNELISLIDLHPTLLSTIEHVSIATMFNNKHQLNIII